MVKNDRAITYMIDHNDPPHHSDRGRQQFVANLLAAIRQHQPAAYAYIDVVHEHVMRVQFDKDHPSPRARFYRCSPDHTGIPDPNYQPPSATPAASTSVSVGQVVNAKGADQAFPSYAAITAQSTPSTSDTLSTAPPGGPGPTPQATPPMTANAVTPQVQGLSELRPNQDVKSKAISRPHRPAPCPQAPAEARPHTQDALALISTDEDEAYFTSTDIRYRSSQPRQPTTQGAQPHASTSTTRLPPQQTPQTTATAAAPPRTTPPNAASPQLSLEQLQRILQMPQLLHQAATTHQMNTK